MMKVQGYTACDYMQVSYAASTIIIYPQRDISYQIKNRSTHYISDTDILPLIRYWNLDIWMECMTNSMFYDMLLLAMFIAVVMFNHTRCRLILEH